MLISVISDFAYQMRILNNFLTYNVRKYKFHFCICFLITSLNLGNQTYLIFRSQTQCKLSHNFQNGDSKLINCNSLKYSYSPLFIYLFALIENGHFLITRFQSKSGHSEPNDVGMCLRIFSANRRSKFPSIR